MTKQEFERLYGNNVGVHCDSELKANEFLALADSFGYKWCSGGSLLSSNEWKYYDVNTVYVCCLENVLAFGAINVALASEMVIVEYQLQKQSEESQDDIGEIKETLKELKLLLGKIEIDIEEKEIPLTIFGYDLKDVIRTTELLRENFISPDDLRNEMEAYERGFNQGVKIGENIYE